jgi:c-di-GMP-binding flagellar brake protein YcgR
MISEPIRMRTPYSLEQSAILEDISVGGACVRTHVRLRPGDTVGLLLNLGVGRRVDARARVVYSNQPTSGYQARYGVRFLGLGEHDESRINQFVVEQKFGRQFGMRPVAASFERPEL